MYKRQVVLAAGFNDLTEGEGQDRTFELPWGQNALIDAVTAANPHTVVTLNGGGEMCIRDRIKARSFSLFVARPSPYRISARVSASGSLTSFTGSGGTHKTGTRERANRANAVPCGPGVSLARLTRCV